MPKPTPTQTTALTLGIHNAIHTENLGLTTYLLIEIIHILGEPITLASLALRANLSHQAIRNQTNRTHYFHTFFEGGRLFINNTPDATEKYHRIKRRLTNNLANPLPVTPHLPSKKKQDQQQTKLF